VLGRGEKWLRLSVNATTGLTDLSLSEANGLLREREISPLEITHAYLSRIEAVDPIVRAFVVVARARALEDARVAEKEIGRGEFRSALHGIPIALKDIVATAGIPTRAGSRVLDDWIPAKDATVAKKLRAGGAVMLGKVTTHEFAMNVYTPPTRNPWNLDRIAGGSSGGSAAAVSARMCLAAIGTDTAGSIRIPASLCGVSGLKPSYARVSRAGVIPFSWSLDHVGPIARSAHDLALMLEVIAGGDPHDPTSADEEVPRYADALDASVADLRVGVPQEYFFEHVTEDTRRAVDTAIDFLRGLGLSASAISLPSAHLAATIGDVISFPEASLYHREWLRDRPEDYSPAARANLEVGELLFATDYIQAQRMRTVVVAETRQAFEDVDVIAIPTTPMPAIHPNETVVSFGSESRETVLDAYCRLTYVANVTGLPALTIPCGFSGDGLPIGMQLLGRPFDEARLLQIAAAYQDATDWHLRPPAALESMSL
jgi:aspartyl-tRNA(Asn)/glutamyl-tRNA(Gln) amidotransferase subunit A